jgi:hypothetical protein
MSREILIRRWCDNTSAHEHPHELEPEIEPARISLDGGAAFALDLCKACRDYLVRPLGDLLAEAGQPIEPEAPRGKRPAAIIAPPGARLSTPRPGSGQPPKPVPEWTCPECDVTMLTTSGPGHLDRRHLAPLGIAAPPQHAACPECGTRHPRPASMAQHRMTRHGFDPRAERLALLAAYRAKHPPRAPHKRTR